MNSSPDQYIVSARKYRPATFDTVVGQRALTTTLKNAILGGKLAQAYLFCGPRGVGKTSCARIFAKTINCLNPTAEGEACGQCESCRAIELGNSFNLVELDAASNNSVDDIRKITDQVHVPPQEGRYRVFIIDEVHMLSNNAFNAFLKTLEEPPKNVVFILATTERHKVIPTILSRCQVYDFRRITVNDIIDHLQYVASKEGVEAQREALGVIALKADGAMRDALSIFDQVVASTHGKVTYEGTLEALNVLDQDYYFRLMENFRTGDVPSALLTFKEITDKGFDALFFINGLSGHIRNLMVSADPRTVSLLETSEEMEKKYLGQAPQLPVEWYYSAMKLLNDAEVNYRTSSNKRFLVELTLIRLSRLLHLLQGTPAVSPPAAAPVQTGGGVQPAPFAVPDRPKPQSAPAPVKEAPLRKQSISRPKSFRISEETSSVSTSRNEGPRSRPFSADEFRAAWDEYISTHPEQRILVAAMRATLPENTENFSFRIKVDHPAQKQAFEMAMTEILEFFKNKLENDFITFSVTISESENVEKKMNPKEFLKMAVDENAELAKFLQAIDAELEV